jgi:hypothetical protein
VAPTPPATRPLRCSTVRRLTRINEPGGTCSDRVGLDRSTIESSLHWRRPAAKHIPLWCKISTIRRTRVTPGMRSCDVGRHPHRLLAALVCVRSVRQPAHTWRPRRRRGSAARASPRPVLMRHPQAGGSVSGDIGRDRTHTQIVQVGVRSAAQLPLHDETLANAVRMARSAGARWWEAHPAMLEPMDTPRVLPDFRVRPGRASVSTARLRQRRSGRTDHERHDFHG